MIHFSSFLQALLFQTTTNNTSSTSHHSVLSLIVSDGSDETSTSLDDASISTITSSSSSSSREGNNDSIIHFIHNMEHIQNDKDTFHALVTTSTTTNTHRSSSTPRLMMTTTMMNNKSKSMDVLLQPQPQKSNNIHHHPSSNIMMSKSIPIACPTPSRDIVREEEFEQDMVYMYNEATWRMYHRIVHARNKMTTHRPTTKTQVKNDSFSNMTTSTRTSHLDSDLRRESHSLSTTSSSSFKNKKIQPTSTSYIPSWSNTTRRRTKNNIKQLLEVEEEEDHSSSSSSIVYRGLTCQQYKKILPNHLNCNIPDEIQIFHMDD